jgi:hypothetical protein
VETEPGSELVGLPFIEAVSDPAGMQAEVEAEDVLGQAGGGGQWSEGIPAVMAG